MKEKAMILLMGGALLAVGIYLFPLYYGAELFASWTTQQAGGDELTGVLWAAIIAGALIVAGSIVIRRPALFAVLGNPMYLAGGAAALILIACVLARAWGG